MSQLGPLNLLTPISAVTSITATAPIEANGLSGVPEVGDVTISISGTGFVSSIAGTTNQIAASSSTGAVTLSLTNGISLGTFQATTPPTGGALIPGNVSVGSSTPDASAVLSATSTTQGFLPPRMTNTQRNAIVSPAQGLTIYSTTDSDVEFWNGSTWVGTTISGVTSVQGTSPITVNGLSGSPQTGAVTVALSTPLTGQFGGTGVANTGLTITLAAGTSTSLMTSDISGNATWGIQYSATGGTSNIVSRDANGNTFANNFTSGTTSTAASGSPINLNPNATRKQITTGTGTQTYKLPNATQLNLGTQYEFNNNATGTVTVNDNSNTLVTTILPGAFKQVFVTNIGSPAGTWDFHSLIPANSTWATAGATLPSTAFVSAGQFLLTGTSSGTISILPQAAAGTFNFNLPTTAGSSGQLLTSAGGGASPMTWSSIGSIAVSSITGTTNQIVASASVGAVTLSFPATGGLSIGSFQASTPPTGGILMPGNIVIGQTSTSTDTTVFVNNSTAVNKYGFQAGGTYSTAKGQASFFADPILLAILSNFSLVGFFDNSLYKSNTAITTTFAASFWASPQFTGNLGTITSAYGYYFDGGTTGGGTITSSYGGYFALPTFGTNKHALHADNMSIGTYTGTSTPPSNSLIVSGNIGINTTTPIAPLDVAGVMRTTSNSGTPGSGTGVEIFYNSGTPKGFVQGFNRTGGSYVPMQVDGSVLFLNGTSGTGVTIASTTSPGSKLDINGNLTVGSSFVGSAAPTNGAIIQGQTSIGTSSPGSYFFNVSPPSPASIPYAALISGTLVADDGVGEQFGLSVSPLYSPNQTNTKNFFNIIIQPTVNLSVNSTQYSGFYHQPTIATTGSNFSLTNFYGVRVIAPSKTGGGTISNAYNGFFVAPTFASTNQALYSDNLSVGYSAVTPPSNGLIVSGNTGIGVNAPSTKFHVFDSSTTPGGELGSSLISGTTTSFPGVPRLCFGINYSGTAMAYGWITAVENGRAARPLSLQGLSAGAGAGVVICSTTTPGSNLDINGNLTVGASYVGTAAPTDGAIIKGRSGIGTSSPNASALLELNSSTLGFLMPINGNPVSNISSPTDGLMTYNNASYWKIPQIFNGSKWIGLTGYSLLSALSFTSTSAIIYTDGDSLPLSQFQTWLILFENLLPVTDSATFEFQVSTDLGVTFISTNYAGGVTSNATGSTNAWNNTNTTSYVTPGALRNTSPAWGYIYVGDRNFSDSTYCGMFSQLGSVGIVNSYNTNAGINAFKIFFSSGNIDTVTVVIYGMHGSQGS